MTSHSVAIPGLYTMRLGVRAKSVASANDVASSKCPLHSQRIPLLSSLRNHTLPVGTHDIALCPTVILKSVKNTLISRLVLLFARFVHLCNKYFL